MLCHNKLCCGALWIFFDPSLPHHEKLAENSKITKAMEAKAVFFVGPRKKRRELDGKLCKGLDVGLSKGRV